VLRQVRKRRETYVLLEITEVFAVVASPAIPVVETAANVRFRPIADIRKLLILLFARLRPGEAHDIFIAREQGR
jgi:hypothetical protein